MLSLSLVDLISVYGSFRLEKELDDLKRKAKEKLHLPDPDEINSANGAIDSKA